MEKKKNNKKNIINHGISEIGRTDKDWVLGGVAEIGGDVLQPDGQWDNFKPVFESQVLPYETFGCVSFSALNCLEFLNKRKYGNELNWSDRFTVKMSGTNPTVGNSLYAVAESIRKNHGLVDQGLWTNNVSTKSEFYAEPIQDVKNAGLNNLGLYQINYEWIDPVNSENLKKALQYAPIQIAIRTDWYKKDGKWFLNAPGATTHAITLYGYKDGDYWKTYDHYLGNEVRLLDWSFFIGAALRYNITKFNIMDIRKEKSLSDVWLITGDGKAKINLADMPSYECLRQLYTEVPDGSLNGLETIGSYVFVNRKIN